MAEGPGVRHWVKLEQLLAFCTVEKVPAVQLAHWRAVVGVPVTDIA